MADKPSAMEPQNKKVVFYIGDQPNEETIVRFSVKSMRPPTSVASGATSAASTASLVPVIGSTKQDFYSSTSMFPRTARPIKI